MNEEIKKGRVIFVNYEKQYATIEYVSNGRKQVNVQLEEEAKLHARPHTFRVGDEVSFQTRLTPRGDKLNAFNVKFLYNTSLHLLIQKAHIENRFSGYLKEAGGRLYVKEINNYLFFPLNLSKWEKRPGEKVLNEAIAFKLVNLDKPARLAAELFSHAYIPEYYEAERLARAGTPVQATVARVSPHAVHLDLFDGKIEARIDAPASESLQAGDSLSVVIRHISPSKIVVERL